MGKQKTRTRPEDRKDVIKATLTENGWSHNKLESNSEWNVLTFWKDGITVTLHEKMPDPHVQMGNVVFKGCKTADEILRLHRLLKGY